MKQVYSKQSVGDICSRFFDGDGNISSEEINKRTIGIELEELKLKKRSILVAGGNRKIKAIDGALRGGYANVLIIDQHTAKELLHYRNKRLSQDIHFEKAFYFVMYELIECFEYKLQF